MTDKRTGQRPVMAYLSDEEFQQFELLKATDLRNTSDMIRFLLREEVRRRLATSEAPAGSDDGGAVIAQ